MTHTDINASTLQAIWNAHGLGQIHTITQPARGMVNRCFLVDDAYVIRFDVLDDDDWPGMVRYAGEKWAYDTLRGSDLPVPQVVALDSSKSLAPNDYLIITRLPGQTVSETRRDLTPQTLDHIGYVAGQHLATIHNHQFDGFGYLFKLAGGAGNPDWAAFVGDFYADYGGQVRRGGWLPEAVLDRIDAVRLKMQPLFALVRQGHFVHGDYHFANMLGQDGNLTGLLDFEWAISGDPAWDFRIDDQLAEYAPGVRAAFYAGYTSLRPLTDHHAERVAFYKLGLYLDYLTFLPDEREDTVRELMTELEWLEANLPTAL